MCFLSACYVFDDCFCVHFGIVLPRHFIACPRKRGICPRQKHALSTGASASKVVFPSPLLDADQTRRYRAFRAPRCHFPLFVSLAAGAALARRSSVAAVAVGRRGPCLSSGCPCAAVRRAADGCLSACVSPKGPPPSAYAPPSLPAPHAGIAALSLGY